MELGYEMELTIQLNLSSVLVQFQLRLTKCPR